MAVFSIYSPESTSCVLFLSRELSWVALRDSDNAMEGTVALLDSAEFLLHEASDATGPVCENYFNLFAET